MTEYALITVAIAILVFIVYEATGQDLSSLVNVVNTDRSTSSRFFYVSAFKDCQD